MASRLRLALPIPAVLALAVVTLPLFGQEAALPEAAPAAAAAVAQGCTPAQWRGQLAAWPEGYTPEKPVADVFLQARWYPTVAQATLGEALSFPTGRPGLAGAMQHLLREGAAAALAAAHPGVEYPRALEQVVADVDAALATANVAKMQALARALAGDNGRGCPLR